MVYAVSMVTDVMKVSLTCDLMTRDVHTFENTIKTHALPSQHQYPLLTHKTKMQHYIHFYTKIRDITF